MTSPASSDPVRHQGAIDYIALRDFGAFAGKLSQTLIEFTFDRPVVVVHGATDSGKTRLLDAVRAMATGDGDPRSVANTASHYRPGKDKSLRPQASMRHRASGLMSHWHPKELMTEVTAGFPLSGFHVAGLYRDGATWTTDALAMTALRSQLDPEKNQMYPAATWVAERGGMLTNNGHDLAMTSRTQQWWARATNQLSLAWRAAVEGGTSIVAIDDEDSLPEPVARDFWHLVSALARRHGDLSVFVGTRRKPWKGLAMSTLDDSVAEMLEL